VSLERFPLYRDSFPWHLDFVSRQGFSHYCRLPSRKKKKVETHVHVTGWTTGAAHLLKVRERITVTVSSIGPVRMV
jgi:hypothetical protein